ncbi:MAG: NAD(P)H-hydrate dehydratase, partial [Rudaea sp.]
LIVDAFLGTGVTRPIEGQLKDILTTVRAEIQTLRSREPELVSPAHPAARPPMPRVAAVDLPSGLNPDTGALDPAALPADLTVTFALPKVGQYAFPGAAAVGELIIADIGIRREWASDVPLEVATGDEIRALLLARPRESNKGTFGKAMIACGSTDFTGAPRLAAAAAGRVGAGLVTLAVPRTIHPIVASTLNEATYLPLHDDGGAWSPEAVAPLLDRARDYSALLVGCGFGRAPSTEEFVSGLIVKAENIAPGVVIDADALNALAEKPDLLKAAHFSAPPVLTPHPGEMARLAGSSIADVQQDRVGAATHHARECNAIVVLKGAFTVVASPDGRAVLLPFADAALATAGTGDVLAGAIAGFLAQYRAALEKARREDAGSTSTAAFNAALVGGYIHGLAGQLAGSEIGLTGVVAGDLVPRLPDAIWVAAGGEVTST